MNYIILAAGQGSRLRPHTDHKPKCLVEPDGKPLLSYQLQIAEALKCDVCVVTGYRADQIQDLGVETRFNAKYESTNMVRSLFCAEDLIKNDVIVCYGDIAYSPEVLEALVASPHDITVVVDANWKEYWSARFQNPLDDAESLSIDEDGFISNIGQKAATIEEIQGQYIGLMRFKGKGLSNLVSEYQRADKSQRLGERPIDSAYMTDMLQHLIDGGQKDIRLGDRFTMGGSRHSRRFLKLTIHRNVCAPLRESWLHLEKTDNRAFWSLDPRYINVPRCL